MRLFEVSAEACVFNAASTLTGPSLIVLLLKVLLV